MFLCSKMFLCEKVGFVVHVVSVPEVVFAFGSLHKFCSFLTERGSIGGPMSKFGALEQRYHHFELGTS